MTVDYSSLGDKVLAVAVPVVLVADAVLFVIVGIRAYRWLQRALSAGGTFPFWLAGSAGIAALMRSCHGG